MDFRRHAFILAVIETLRKYGSWTGKTHVNKALSLLRDKAVIEVPFQFVLYKHGPYSFDVQAEMEEMRSYGAVEIESNPQGYGVVLKPGPMAGFVKEAASLSEVEIRAVDEVCQFVGGRNVAELERLATASWIRRQERIDSARGVAIRLHALKPHVPVSEAERADTEIARWLHGTN